MSTHQDTAARYVRATQALAVLAVVFAVGMFLVPFPAPRIEPQGGVVPPPTQPQQTRERTFHTNAQDWTTILASLSTHRDPIEENDTEVANGPGGPGGEVVDDSGTVALPPGRPNWRYLGPLIDNLGKAALVEVDGRQRLLREGSEFSGHRLKEVADDWIVVVGPNGAEHEIPMETSNLASAAPSQPPAVRPRGRAGQPNRPIQPPTERTRVPVPYEPAQAPEDAPEPDDGGSRR